LTHLICERLHSCLVRKCASYSLERCDSARKSLRPQSARRVTVRAFLPKVIAHLVHRFGLCLEGVPPFCIPRLPERAKAFIMRVQRLTPVEPPSLRSYQDRLTCYCPPC
jgi:hypothetical protein